MSKPDSNADTVEQMLTNHSATSFDSVRDDPEPSPSAPARGESHEDFILRVMHDAIDRNDLEIDKEQVHAEIGNFKRRHGDCQYNRKKHNGVRREGHYVIRVAKNAIKNEVGVESTILHELAHAETFERHGYIYSSSGHQVVHHGREFKRTCRDIGVKEDTCASESHTKDYKYHVGCTECGWENGRHRMCKAVRGTNRICKHCGESTVSWDAGKEMPTEPGTADVDRLKD